MDGIEIYRSTQYSLDGELQAIYLNQPIFDAVVFGRMYSKHYNGK